MKKYVLKRLLIAIPTFLGITLLVFTLCYFATGSPLELIPDQQSGERNADGRFVAHAALGSGVSSCGLFDLVSLGHSVSATPEWYMG